MNTRKPGRFLPLRSYQRLLRFVATFNESLRREPEFSAAMNADLRAFRAELFKAVRAQLRLRRGRPTDPKLDRACELLKRGKPVAEVLRSQVPGFAKLDPYTRYLLAKGLRQAAARRKRRSKRPVNRTRKPTPKKDSLIREDQ
jgi:hypothetical protein